MDAFLQDLRQALRRLARSPGFTFIAVLTLALAIGANTAIWSVVHGLLLRPLPFPEPDRLVQVRRTSAQGISTQFAIPRFLYWRDHAQVFDHLALFDNLGAGLNLVGDGPPERILGSRVSRDFLSVLGIHPLLGRDFLPEEDRPGARRVVLLSYGLWNRRFGADPGILGRVAPRGRRLASPPLSGARSGPSIPSSRSPRCAGWRRSSPARSASAALEPSS
jgi:putative ABC transport system permease protein